MLRCAGSWPAAALIVALAAACGGTGPGAQPGDEVDAGAIAADGDSVGDTSGRDAYVTDGPPARDRGAADGAGADGPAADAGVDAGVRPLSRGLRWVRDNPMFVSGLAVSVGAPSTAQARAYFDEFHANAIHLWADGMGPELNAWRAAMPGARWVSWLQNNGTSVANGQLIGGYPANTAGRIGYQVGDEPRNMQELKDMEAGANAVRQVDPDALIYLNFTSWADDAMLTYYGEQMDCDVISYDRYTRNNNSYEQRARFREYGLAYDMPYWRYSKSYFTGDAPATHASDLRWDVYAGLVYGYTGHSWFVYQIDGPHEPKPVLFTNRGDLSVARTALYDEAAQLNIELRHLGRVITQLTSTDVRYIPALPLLQPRRTSNWQQGAGGDPYITSIAPATGAGLLDLLVGFFVDDVGERYVMVQNVRHRHGDWPINNADPGTARIEFDFSAAPAVDAGKLLTVDATTGAVGSLALADLGGGRAGIELVLEAGDGVLFKYATGRPFAMGPAF